MTKICVPVFGNDFREARERAERALSSGAHLIEIRADLIPGFDIDCIESDFSDMLDRAIITLRSKEEGGRSDLSEDKRVRWLKAALSLRPAYVDLELETDKELISSEGEKRKGVIVSKHFFSSWKPEEIKRVLAECCALGDIGKVAAHVNNIIESVQLLELLEDIDNSNHALMAMGVGGEITRALAASIGSEIVYCALDRKSMVAPGQLDLQSQKRLLSDGRFVVGLIGHPLGHTLSPIMHNEAFEALGLPGVYLPFDIPDSSQLSVFLRSSAKLGVKGINVTIPYKEAAFSAMDWTDDEARRAGEINAIVVDDDVSLKGYNNDIFGLSESLARAGFNPRNRRALIVGAGGASRAAIIALWKMGAKIDVANRTPERAEELVRSMRVFIRTLSLDQLAAEKPYNLIVNATPVGMKGFEGAPIVPEKLISSAEVVMDMIYNPPETSLIRAARQHGVKAISGMEMLLYQGAKAFELWCGVPAPVEIMRKRLMEAIES